VGDGMITLDTLRAHLELQNIAVAVAKNVQDQLQTGQSELDAVKMLEAEFSKQGITKYFHRPFAWFGQRSGFIGFAQPLTFKNGRPRFGSEFFPKSDVILQPGMPVILDAAPASPLATVDIGYSFCHGEHQEHAKAMELLSHIRTELPKLFEASLSIGEIYSEVDRRFAENGYSNIHSLYPKGVLGHRVGPLPMHSLPSPHIARFSLQAFLYFIKNTPSALFFDGRNTPFLRAGVCHKPKAGLWAVEPHLRAKDFGAKFEEILIFDGKSARWLSEEKL
jgi:Xaa-Pro aminopeptidase